MGEAPIEGHCDSKFRAVREAFAHNFEAEDEIGAAVCVQSHDRILVDLWGGHVDDARTTPWRADTLVNAYSVGKGILAALVLTLVETGQLDLDEPVSRLWPEFGAEGKGAITLRTLLSHRAGLPAVRKPLPAGAMLDWSLMCGALAEQAPYWTPNTRHGYHVNTFGFLVGEVIRRVTDTRAGEALRDFVTGPLGADYHWGVPPSEHHRIATTCTVDADVALTSKEQWSAAFPPTGDAEHDAMIWHGYFNPPGLSGSGVVNTAAWRNAEIPSTNGHGTARAVSTIYAALLGGGPGGPRLASPERIAEATRIASDGDDAVLGRPSRFGLGFQLAQPSRPIGPNATAFGHFGYGGTLGFADPEAGIAFGYLMNRPGQRWQTPRTQHLIDAVYESLGRG